MSRNQNKTWNNKLYTQQNKQINEQVNVQIEYHGNLSKSLNY